jgi:transcriptional regulator with XRE-family HTH domain
MIRTDSPTFGALLRRYRLVAGLTQEALAERAHLSRRAIAALEQGISRAPRAATLTLLAEALALSAPARTALAAAARQEARRSRSPPQRAPPIPASRSLWWDGPRTWPAWRRT